MFEGKVIVYVNQSNHYTKEQLEKWDSMVKEKNVNVQYIYVEHITDLFPKLSNAKFHVDIINIGVESLIAFNKESPYSLITTLKTLASTTLSRNKLTGKTTKRDVKIIGTVNYFTTKETIKELLPYVDGLCLSLSGKWTLEMVLDDQIKLLKGDLSIPKEIQRKLKARKKKEKVENANGISLTPRQKQVLTLVVMRGASNKIIARTLNISESTVKLHLGLILKKYGVKSRTQLAVFCKDTF